MLILDKHGWPIESVKGRYFDNFIRKLIHINIFNTLTKQKLWVRCENGGVKNINQVNNNSVQGYKND